MQIPFFFRTFAGKILNSKVMDMIVPTIVAFFVGVVCAAFSLLTNVALIDYFLCIMLGKKEVIPFKQIIKDYKYWYVRLLIIPSCIISAVFVVLIRTDCLPRELLDALFGIFYTPFAILFFSM